MLDFDAGKLLIIGVVALIVIGPKDLPRVLRQLGQAVARVKRMAAEFQGQFMDAMREADLEAIREDLKKAAADTELDARFDPARDIQRELTASVSLDGSTLATASSPEVPLAALEPTVPAVTDGFALPTVDAAAEAGASPADAGAVPIAPVEAAREPEDAAALLPGAAERPAPKRRIRVRRRPLGGRRVHPVLDRTGLSRPATPRIVAGDPRS